MLKESLKTADATIATLDGKVSEYSADVQKLKRALADARDANGGIGRSTSDASRPGSTSGSDVIAASRSMVSFLPQTTAKHIGDAAWGPTGAVAKWRNQAAALEAQLLEVLPVPRSHWQSVLTLFSSV